MPDFDSPWKEALDLFFEQFMSLCFPHIHTEIDWSHTPQMLDKELQQLAPESESGLRTVDKLVSVQLRDGEMGLILIHLEIQSQATAGFSERMYVYNYRIAEKYNKNVVSLAVLGDDRPGWRPDRYTRGLFGCKVLFEFPIVKLLDFLNETDRLHGQLIRSRQSSWRI